MKQADQFPSDPQMCHQCGGLCCQGHPGLWTVPERFLSIFSLTANLSQTALQTKLESYKLTLRDVGGILIPAPQGTPSGCIFLGPNGCELPTERRPDQCRALTPSIDTLIQAEINCTLPAGYGSGTARERWEAFWSNR